MILTKNTAFIAVLGASFLAACRGGGSNASVPDSATNNDTRAPRFVGQVTAPSHPLLARSLGAAQLMAIDL